MKKQNKVFMLLLLNCVFGVVIEFAVRLFLKSEAALSAAGWSVFHFSIIFLVLYAFYMQVREMMKKAASSTH